MYRSITFDVWIQCIYYRNTKEHCLLHLIRDELLILDLFVYTYISITHLINYTMYIVVKYIICIYCKLYYIVTCLNFSFHQNHGIICFSYHSNDQIEIKIVVR